MRSLPVPRALTSALVLALSGGATLAGPAPAADCKKLRETRGCKLPSGAQYFKYQGANNQIDVNVLKGGRATLRIRSACVVDTTVTLRFRGTAKIGGTYKFSDTKVVQPDPDQGQRQTTTYVLTATLRITSARKASLTGTAKVTAPAVPPNYADNFPGEDAYNSSCSLNRTLNRAQA